MRILKSEFIDGKWYVEMAGDSDETKPATDNCEGSIFVETDTGDVYFFNETDG